MLLKGGEIVWLDPRTDRRESPSATLPGILSALFNRVRLPFDRLPVVLHLRERLATGRGEPIVLPFRAIGRFCFGRLDQASCPQSGQNVVDRAAPKEQALGLGQSGFDLVAVHPAIADLVENRKVQKSLTDLIGPVIEEFGIHGLHDRQTVTIGQ